jgi:hypothetical protein
VRSENGSKNNFSLLEKPFQVRYSVINSFRNDKETLPKVVIMDVVIAMGDVRYILPILIR